MPWEKFCQLVQSVSVPGLIINKESVAPPGQSGPELMAADMQVIPHACPQVTRASVVARLIWFCMAWWQVKFGKGLN